MKPRLEPAPLTTEDREIWFYLAPLSGPGVDRVRWFRLAMMADRKDADIMYSVGLYNATHLSKVRYLWAPSWPGEPRPDLSAPHIPQRKVRRLPDDDETYPTSHKRQ